MAPASAIVTGASGFIGTHLVVRLLAVGSRVSVPVRPSNVLPLEWRDRVSVVTSDDFSERGLRRLLHAPVETVFHLAAYGVRPSHRDIDEMIAINVGMSAALVRLCAEWRARMIMAGTFSEYRSPSTREPLTESSPLEKGKLRFSTSSMWMTSSRPCCGPMRIAESKGGVATWNVATGRGRSVREFTECVAGAMQADASVLGFGAIAMRKDDEPWLVGSPDLLRAELGWQPSVGLDEGIRAAVAALLPDHVTRIGAA